MDKVDIFTPAHHQIRLPRVVRYMNERHVEAFFAHGDLRLSSLRAFREHTDSMFRDELEGRFNFEVPVPGGGTGAGVAISDSAIYALCATTNASPDPSTWPYKHGIRINFPLRFGALIASHVPGFVKAVQGQCNYEVDRVRRVPSLPPPDPRTVEADPHHFFDEFDAWVRDHALDSFFFKHSKYFHEMEYRMLWVATGHESNHLDICCPEAVEWCERVVL